MGKCKYKTLVFPNAQQASLALLSLHSFLCWAYTITLCKLVFPVWHALSNSNSSRLSECQRQMAQRFVTRSHFFLRRFLPEEHSHATYADTLVVHTLAPLKQSCTTANQTEATLVNITARRRRRIFRIGIKVLFFMLLISHYKVSVITTVSKCKTESEIAMFDNAGRYDQKYVGYHCIFTDSGGFAAYHSISSCSFHDLYTSL